MADLEMLVSVDHQIPRNVHKIVNKNTYTLY